MGTPNIPGLVKAEVNPVLLTKKMEKTPPGVWMKAQWTRAQTFVQGTIDKIIPPPDEEAMAVELAAQIDVDKVAKSFRKNAGFDDDMDKDEFAAFCEDVAIQPALAKTLWKLMDEDGSGSVTEEEFKGALIKLRMASQWVRFCPTCQYRHDCAFCLEAKICPNCSDKRFCQKCWDHHPGRPDEARDAGRGHLVVGSGEWVQETLKTQPLEKAYEAASQTKLPIEVKAQVRQAMRKQQLASSARLGALHEQYIKQKPEDPEHLSAVWNPGNRVAAGGSLSTSVTWPKPKEY